MDPPAAPTKYWDYQIMTLLFKAKKENAIAAIQEKIPSFNGNRRLAEFILLELRYQMFGSIKHNKNARLIPIQDHYNKLKANPLEIAESQKISQQIIYILQQNQQNYLQNLSINPIAFLGYHIGDGSFGLSLTFGKQNQSFQASLSWNLTDCKENKPILEAIKAFLESKHIEFSAICWKDEGSYVQLIICFKIENCKRLVDLFNELDAQNLFPQVRLNQFKCFSIYSRFVFRSKFER